MAWWRILRDSRLALLLTSSVMSVLVAEASVAYLWPQPIWRRVLSDTPAMFVPAEVLPYELKPGFTGRFRRPEFDTWIHINSSGFRGPELRDSGEPRILVLGDSFTFGHGVGDGEAYPALLDQLVGGVEVVNGGFAAGASPDMYYVWLRGRGEHIRFDGVVIGFFIGNDIDGHPEIVWDETDALALPTRVSDVKAGVVDGYLRPRETPIRYRFPILRNSHLFHLAGSAHHQLERAWKPPRRALSVFDAEYSQTTLAAIDVTIRVFRGIKWWCAGRGIPLGVVMIPTVQQVTGAAHDRPQQRFAAAFSDMGVPYLDLRPALAGRPEAYFAEDLHWNVVGHRLAAAAVAEWLKTIGLGRPQ